MKGEYFEVYSKQINVTVSTWPNWARTRGTDETRGQSLSGSTAKGHRLAAWELPGASSICLSFCNYLQISVCCFQAFAGADTVLTEVFKFWRDQVTQEAIFVRHIVTPCDVKGRQKLATTSSIDWTRGQDRKRCWKVIKHGLNWTLIFIFCIVLLSPSPDNFYDWIRDAFKNVLADFVR